jgi:hypothetical protein
MPEPSTEGMTVNERLFHFGPLAEFDAATRAGDLASMIEVLRRARLSEEQATQTAEAVLADPSRYGY